MKGQAIFPRLVLGFAIAAAALWLALNRERLDPALIEGTIRSLGFWAPVGHVVLFALATVLFVPGLLLGLAGGVLFGPVWGTLVSLAGATLGATAAFLVLRGGMVRWMRRVCRSRPGGSEAKLRRDPDVRFCLPDRGDQDGRRSNALPVILKASPRRPMYKAS